MAAIPKVAVTYGISKLPQSNFQTVSASADYIPLITIGRSFGTVTPTVTDDSEYATGYADPTEQIVESWDTERSFDVALSAELAGVLLRAALGAVNSTVVLGASPAAYIHGFLPVDLATVSQLPAYTLVEYLGGLKRVFPSMVLKKLTLKADKKGRLTCSVTMKGSGDIIRNPGSGYALVGGPPFGLGSLHYWQKVNGTLELSGADGNIHPSCALESWTLDIENTLAEGEGYYCPLYQDSSNPDSGQIRSELLVTGRKMTLSGKVRSDSADKWEGYLLSQAPLTGQLVLAGKQFATANSAPVNYRLVTNLGKAQVTGAPYGVEGFTTQEFTLNLLADPLEELPPLTMQLLNGVPAYA